MVINEGLKSKTLKSGKTRFSIEIKSEPILINVDAKALGQPVALAIAHHLREKMLAISAVASPATLRARRSAELAIQAGKQWAVRRYAGGKMGGRAPNQSDRLFNDSGRFAESIAIQPTKDNAWRINVAANRLDPSTANDGAAGVQRIWQRLVQLVPEFGSIDKLMRESDIVRAMIRTQERMITKGRPTTGKASAWDVAKAAGDLVKTALEIGGRLAA